MLMEQDNNEPKTTNRRNEVARPPNSLSSDEIAALSLYIDDNPNIDFSNLINDGPFQRLTRSNSSRINRSTNNSTNRIPEENRITRSNRSINRSLRVQNSENYDLDDYESNLRLAEMIGKVEVGFKEQDLERIPEFIYEGQNLSDKSCSICLGEWSEGETLYRISCLHCFHKDCLNNWFKSAKTCPICNITVDLN